LAEELTADLAEELTADLAEELTAALTVGFDVFFTTFLADLFNA
jgi:hypothetical protein